jgi:hypothetical protein
MLFPEMNENLIIHAIKNCEYYDLTEKQSLELINGKLSKPISRSTYYNYKNKLYQDEKFQSLKKSIYKSKLFKSLMLYMDDDDADNPDGYDFNKLISEQFPNKQDIFCITDEQFDKNSRLYDKIKSNFCMPSYKGPKLDVNLTRTTGLPNNYTLREEYIRCGKGKINRCKSCPHGPYYYAYWREKFPSENKSILRKKYVGSINPRL